MIQPAKIHVRYADLDTMGHVNNAVYLSYFENARVEVFKQLLGTDWDWKKNGFLVVRNEVDYLQPIFLKDEPLCSIYLEYIGTKSFVLVYHIMVNEVLVTKGKSYMVCFDATKNCSVAVSNEWKDALSKLNSLSNS